jgi:SAM-dependent methyltransferase
VVGVPDEVQEFYARGDEQDRLERGRGRLEALRTWELLMRWLPAPPATVVDVGGAAGRYALPLSALGHRVHLIDPVPLHVSQAEEASRSSDRPLASVHLGDARELPFDEGSVGAVLLLGPLYHLPHRDDRLQALSEARRVLRSGGVVVAAAITRWASAVDGLRTEAIRDPQFADIVTEAMRSGVHSNPTGQPQWFTTAYFHRPEDLPGEIADAGLQPEGPVAVEGLAGLASDLDVLLDDESTRERVLGLVRATEHEVTLLGASSHLLIAGIKPPG